MKPVIFRVFMFIASILLLSVGTLLLLSVPQLTEFKKLHPDGGAAAVLPWYIVGGILSFVGAAILAILGISYAPKTRPNPRTPR